MNMTVKEFCRKHNACKKCMNWAVKNCQNMEDVWQKAKPEWLVWVATREGVLTDKELMWFEAWWSVRQAQYIRIYERCVAVFDAAVKRYANENATLKEVNAARAAARMLAWESASVVVWEAQAEYLRQNCKPNFNR